MKKQGKLIKILCATLILLMLSGCSASISDTQTSELVHIANGIYWLSDSEYMIDRIFDDIEYLRQYRLALEYNDSIMAEYYSSKACDIYMCGLHMWYNDDMDEVTEIIKMCDIAGVDFQKYESYLLDIDGRIPQLINMLEMLTYYEETKNQYFFDEFDMLMGNIDSWLADYNTYDWTMSPQDIIQDVTDYVNATYGMDLSENEVQQ